jgi:hypothetical protein
MYKKGQKLMIASRHAFMGFSLFAKTSAQFLSEKDIMTFMNKKNNIYFKRTITSEILSNKIPD